MNAVDVLSAGKRRIALDLKTDGGQSLLRRLCLNSDVLIEPFRPGVMEKLNLGPDTLLADNPRLVYARLTGFGQTGPLANRAGHDINYLAISGVLSMLGRHGQPPHPPVNLFADMAGGGLLCALGICMALLERHRSGRGQIVDNSMVEGAAYVASWLTRAQRRLPVVWGEARGRNMLDGGRFYYDCYETSETGRYMSVGALEPHFFRAFADGLGLPQLQQFSADEREEAESRRAVAEAFRKRTQAEWAEVFAGRDACVFPVLDWQEQAARHEHNAERGVFVDDPERTGDDVVAAPAPRLSRTPAQSSVMKGNRNGGAADVDWVDVLREIGVTGEEMRRLKDDGVLLVSTTMDSKL